MGSAADFAGIAIGLGVGMKVADKMAGGRLLGDGAESHQPSPPAPVARDPRVTCATCGADAPAGAFCSACGAALAAEAPNPGAPEVG